VSAPSAGALRASDVALAALGDEDLPRLFEWINDRETALFNAAYRPVHEPDHRAWFDDIRARRDVAIFGIRRLRDGELVGSCQLHGIDPVHRSAELQIRIGKPEARGQGLGEQAVRLLLRFGFGDLNLHRIALHVFASNEPALRLYEKVGFRHEGVLRQAAYIDGQYVDVVLMAILQSEFDAS
jgi:RimJ/RimL family protein N-acetyltransferase